MTNNTNKKTLSILTSSAIMFLGFMTILLASPILAQSVTSIGNDATQRAQLDTASNFTVIDTNHPATSSGTISSFGYYASNTNPFSFVLVNSSNVVEYVSPLITPTATGANTYTPTSAVPIQAGWNLGVYFSSTGTVPFENAGATASWTAVGSGAPTAGGTLSFVSSGSRTYSIMGSGTTTTTPTLTSVTVTPTTESLNIGGTQQLTANPMDQNSVAFSGATLSYMSSNTSVATVSSTGLITGVGNGSATITVTATSGSASVTRTSTVTVTTTTNNPVLTSVTVTPTTESLNIGGTQQLTANPMDQNSVAFSGATLSYMSSNTSVATVSSTGLITGVGNGSATITVTATSGSASVTRTSTVMVNDNSNNPGESLRIRIILDMVRRLLAQLGIQDSFTTSNGLTF